MTIAPNAAGSDIAITAIDVRADGNAGQTRLTGALGTAGNGIGGSAAATIANITAGGTDPEDQISVNIRADGTGTSGVGGSGTGGRAAFTVGEGGIVPT